ncbi:MAG TPA: transglutaminaseTgpA domain-containing protein [Acidimicrobiales bacterium]|nr:transglutaminaseTgpA domain-containing protein [Acidimicrobiales bacterium]
MGFLAALAVALSATCAAAAAGGMTVADVHVPTWAYSLALLPGLGVAITRRGSWVRPRSKSHDLLFSIILIASGLLIVSGFSANAGSLTSAPAAAGAVLLLSLYWPDPPALGVGILSSFVYLVTAPHGSGATAWTVAAVAAGAYAAVATARLYRSQFPTFGRANSGWRQTAQDGAVVLIIAGLFGAVLAAVVPSPPRNDANRRFGGGAPEDGAGTLSPMGLAPGLNLAEARTKGRNTVVLRVAASEPDAWRAGTYETWTGRRWEFSAVPEEEEDPVGSRDFLVPPQPGEVISSGTRFVQRVTIETDYAQVLVGAPVPTRIVAPEGSYVLSYAGVLVEGPVMERHSSYVVESARSFPTAEQLRAIGSETGETPPELAGYRATPPADARVNDLARQITAGAPTTYDKVIAVRNWLATNTELRDSDDAVPRGNDVVAHFLFVERGGRVERSATAMAVMLRTLGISTRLAVGFAPGERAAPGGRFTVRASDATAWPEVWFPGAGWQRFDPAGPLVVRPAPKAQSFWQQIRDLVKRLWPLLFVILLGLAGWVLFRRKHSRQLETLPWATRFYARLLDAGKKRERPLKPYETPLEYTSILAESALPDPRLVEVGALITSAAYSGREPSLEESEWAEAVLAEATAATPPPSKR